MIRGAIDHSGPYRISGWFYSDVASVRDRTVLAFLDGACVGAGRVDIFRQDLVDAGLGDGFLGFSFRISLPSEEELSRVVVRLESSDLVLLQSGAKIAARDDAVEAEPQRQPVHTLSSLQWKLNRGWLQPNEYDLLKGLTQLGVHDWALGIDVPYGRESLAVEELAKIAKASFELYYAEPLDVHSFDLSSLSDLAELLAEIPSANESDSIIAIWSSARSQAGVVEGSHRASELGGELDEGFLGATDYTLAQDHLLFLNKRCKIEPRSTTPGDGFVIFSASLARK